jgi:NAD(P)-dependent dehydrogenase (short-subunit alcohol dehydrogenase family)
VNRRTYETKGRTVLVTGAARGIGLDAARRLHARGANVALVGLEPEALEQRAAELGDRAAWFEADVRSLEQLEAAVAGTVERFGGLDVVIANAGIGGNGSVGSMDPAAFDLTIDVNLNGVFRTVRAALPHVVAARGYVLVISSASAAMHLPLMSAYTASKAGVEAFGDALRGELAPKGVGVGVAYFSFIDTDMVRRGFDRPSAQRARDELGGLFARVAPLEAAGEAIVAGVERRARVVAAPRSVLALLALRSVLQPLNDLALRRNRRFAETLRVAETEETELTTPQRPG